MSDKRRGIADTYTVSVCRSLCGDYILAGERVECQGSGMRHICGFCMN